jgi:hypothetical protein
MNASLTRSDEARNAVIALQHVVQVQPIIFHRGVDSRRILSRTYQCRAVPTGQFLEGHPAVPGGRAQGRHGRANSGRLPGHHRPAPSSVSMCLLCDNSARLRRGRCSAPTTPIRSKYEASRDVGAR